VKHSVFSQVKENHHIDELPAYLISFAKSSLRAYTQQEFQPAGVASAFPAMGELKGSKFVIRVWSKPSHQPSQQWAS
jgi:hypothetical protein